MVLCRLRIEEVASVRRALVEAAIALSQFAPTPPDLARTIQTGLEDDTAAREFWADAAGRAGLTETSARLLELMLSDPDEDVRNSAAESYGRVAEPDALLGLITELAASEPTSEQMSTLASALSCRLRAVVDQLVERITETGGHTIVTDRAVVVKYPAFTHNLLLSSEPRDMAALLEGLSSSDAGERWNALDALADWWREPGVLGRIAVAGLDPNACVAGRSAEILRDLASTYEPDAMDAESRAVLARPGNFASLIDLLESPDSPHHVRWLLTHVEFIPQLLHAAVSGRDAVRPVLWNLADRHGLRLFADGSAVLSTGRLVRWEDLPGALPGTD
jgi:hypothetical protein